MSFLTPVDISNRCLQHCGADRIDVAQGFAEDSKNASECAFVYDKLRQAELRRNVWRFAIKRAALRAIDATTMLVAPALWVGSTTYFVGSLVQDETNQYWISLVADNLNNQPQNSLTWAEYFGPLSASLWTASTSYYRGEIVYVPVGTGINRVYLSLQDGNSDTPAGAPAWSATTTYMKDQIVIRSAVAYLSLIDLNINQDPATMPAAWSSGSTYSIGNLVAASDGMIYSSVLNGNIGHDPTLDTGIFWTSTGVPVPWTATFTGGQTSLKWLQIGGPEFPMGVGLRPLSILYPLTQGPSPQTSQRNAFRLPAGYLRAGPQDPKAGSVSALGAPSGLTYSDWELEGDFIVTRMGDPIVFRFVADTVDVTKFDPLFCEGLGARMALELCEILTQSTSKLVQIRADYQRVMTEARLVNGIETDPEEPPEDDYITARV